MPAEQRLQLVAGVAEDGRELRAHAVVDLLPDEVAVELRADELRRRRLLQDDVDDVVAVERARAAEERSSLPAEVVLLAVELELEDVVGPPGEGAGAFADVALGVVPDAEAEQLESSSRPKFSFGWSFTFSPLSR